MSEIRFKTEWLTQIALAAGCGTPDDVADLCCAIQREALGLPVNEMSSLVETLFIPIKESIEADRQLSRARSEARKGNKTETKSGKTSTKTDKTTTKQNKEKEEEKKETSPTPPKESKEVSKEKDTAHSVDNTKVLSPSFACAEPEISASTPAQEPVITLPLNDGTEYPIYPDMVAEFSSLYPAVDVSQELRNMKGWILGKPERRKTKRGIRAFITTWLSKEQDRGPRQNARSGTTQRRLRPEEVAALPAIDPFAVLREG